jgi:DNA-binding NarL/FixJ family response regulator
MSKIRILIADDHTLIRDGIKALLQQEPEFEVIGEASDGLELIKLATELVPDIIVLDLSMPGKNGIEVIKDVKNINVAIKCIILSMHEDPDYVVKSIQAGAKGYILKNAEHEEIIRAIKSVQQGNQYYNAHVSSILINGLSNNVVLSQDDYSTLLSSREKEVLIEVAAGQSTKMIADNLGISSRTVETHRINIMKKLNAQNTAELIKIAMDKKII